MWELVPVIFIATCSQRTDLSRNAKDKISLLGKISVVDESLKGRMYIFMGWTYTVQIGQILYVQPPLDACKHY